MRRLLFHWVISAVAFWLTALIVRGVDIVGWYNVLWLAPLLGLLNAVVGGIAGLISWVATPVNLLTLGCFGFVLSLLGYWLAVYLLGLANLDAFRVAGPLPAFWFALVMALFSFLLNMVLPRRARR